MQTTTLIIGAGQAGLAMSRHLSNLSVDHVLLERGQVANSWRTERWDSLRLLTPNWMTRLPGHEYTGADPEGYMDATQVVDQLESYRQELDAPVVGDTTVKSVSESDSGYQVVTDDGIWSSRSVVIASGAASDPYRPAISKELPATVQQLAPINYRNPGQLDAGRVLIVGASASGIQLAAELAEAGFGVTLAVGNHVRLPRTYRGMNIHWWMDAAGVLNDRYSDAEDIAKARRSPSAQLIGSDDQRNIDLNTVAALGVEVVGRLVGITGSQIQFSGSLANMCVSADLKQFRLLGAIDEYASANGLNSEVGAPDRPERTQIPEARMNIPVSEFDTVIWATGYRPKYPWLGDHLLDAKGAIRHDGGVMTRPGMYVIGLPFLRTRKSGLIDGVGRDAEYLSNHLMAGLSVGTFGQGDR